MSEQSKTPRNRFVLYLTQDHFAGMQPTELSIQRQGSTGVSLSVYASERAVFVSWSGSLQGLLRDPTLGTAAIKLGLITKEGMANGIQDVRICWGTGRNLKSHDLCML